MGRTRSRSPQFRRAATILLFTILIGAILVGIPAIERVIQRRAQGSDRLAVLLVVVPVYVLLHMLSEALGDPFPKRLTLAMRFGAGLALLLFYLACLILL